MKKNTGGARLQKRPRNIRVWAILLGIVAVIVLIGGTFCALAATSDTILPRTTVFGESLSGLTQSEAEERLSQLLPEAYTQPAVSVYLDEEEVCSLSLAELGVRLSAEECARRAYAIGHSGNLLRDGYDYAAALLLGHSVSPTTDLDETLLRKAVDGVAQQVNCEPAPLSCHLQPEDSAHVYFTQQKDGVILDEEALLRELSRLLEDASISRVNCVYETVPYSGTVTLDSLTADWQSEGKNAFYDSETNTVIEAQIGIAFDRSDAERLLQQAAGGEKVAVDATVQFPSIYAKELSELLFRDVIGSYSTVVTGTAARINNVRLAAAACNGKVLNSGDVFSFNETVGKRTEARGYRPASAYVAGETVDVIGGGICQVSSTIYASCLYANLEIVQRTAHRYVSSYIEDGLDATVSWGTLDYQFRNSTDYPIKIVTSMSNGTLYVSLYGTKTDDTYVKMTSTLLSTTKWSTQYEDTDELPAGKEEVKQTPYTGRKVQTYRNVYAADGTLLSTTPEALSDYKSRDKIILRGTEAAPPAGDDTTPGIDDGTGDIGAGDSGSDDGIGVNPPDDGDGIGGGTNPPETGDGTGGGDVTPPEIDDGEGVGGGSGSSESGGSTGSGGSGSSEGSGSSQPEVDDGTGT